MPARLFPSVAIAVTVAALAGCKDKPTRRDPLQRQAPPPGAPTLYPDHLEAAQQPFTPPSPPNPPPLPNVTPPRPTTAVAAGVPPLPGANAPTEMPPPAPAPLVVAGNTAPQLLAPPSASAPPVMSIAPPPPPGSVIASTEPLTPQPVASAAPAPLPLGSPVMPTTAVATAVPASVPAGLPASAPAPLTTAIPASAPPPAPTPVAVPPADVVRELVAAANAKWAAATDYECRLVKREVVNGKKMPQDEIAYKVRKQPLSVAMVVLSAEGQGRQVVFVQGRDDKSMHVAIGKGDRGSSLMGVGYKTTVDPNGSEATSKSRYRIYEAGFGRTLAGLQTAAAAGRVKALGKVTRPEYPYPLDALEVAIRPGDDPLFPRGGTRTVFLDPNPDSPSFRMPVLTLAVEPSGQEVEYYSFDRIRMPAGLTDADFDPARMGKKR